MDGSLFTISNIYGPTWAADKGSFFQELRDSGNRVRGAWALMGDFNVPLSPQDKNGPPSRLTEVLNFRKVVNDIGVQDLPIVNKRFTWSNGRPHPTLERLDRALVSQAWCQIFPRSSLRALPRPRSDHTPVVLTAYSFVPSCHLFRLEAYWLRHPGALDAINSVWETPCPEVDPVRRFSSKLGTVSGALSNWSEGLTSRLLSQSKACLSWLEWLDRAEEIRALLPVEVGLRIRLKIRFDEISLQEEIRWKQRSRVHWLKAGDSNTKFFHLRASARKAKNFISLLNTGSRTLSDHGSIASYLFDYFVHHLGSKAGDGTHLDLRTLLPDDSLNLLGLEDPFTEDEVKFAVLSLAPDKAPGPDGFPLLFYHCFWSCIKVDLMKIFDSLHKGSLDLSPVNHAWICLIPKRLVALEARDFRPICLVNGLSKIISKVLASRLQGVLGGLVNRFQTTFIRGRTLTDTFFTAHIMTHHLATSKRQTALFKIDFE